MKRLTSRFALAAHVLVIVAMVSGVARAADDKKKKESKGVGEVTTPKPKHPLDGAPAIRHKYEVRKGRFEVGPSFAFSLNRAFMHALLLGLKAEYHINDYLSVGADIGFGLNFQTGLAGELHDTYPDDSDEWKAIKSRLSRLTVAGDVRGVFTPFAGKMGIFSAAFIGYDVYFFAGVALAMTGNDTDEDNVDETNERFTAGFAWGVGAHFFINHWVSIGLELKDLIFTDNETGQDVTRGLTDEEISANDILVNGDDKKFLNHFFVGLNVTFFLPPTPKIGP